MNKLNKRDINRAFNRWWYANEIPNNHDYLLGPSLLYALIPILKKLYPKIDDLKESTLVNFYSLVGINFQNIASNDAMMT